MPRKQKKNTATYCLELRSKTVFKLTVRGGWLNLVASNNSACCVVGFVTLYGLSMEYYSSNQGYLFVL